MAYFKSLLYMIIGGGVSYILLSVTSVSEEDFVTKLHEQRKYPSIDKKQQEQISKILKRAARVSEPMSQQDQGDANSTSSKLTSNISTAEK